MAKKKKKKESLFGMIRQGKNYETAQAKRTKAHPVRKKAAQVDYLEKLKREAMAPVETDAQRRKRLKKEKRKKTMLSGSGYSRDADKVLRKIQGK